MSQWRFFTDKSPIEWIQLYLERSFISAKDLAENGLSITSDSITLTLSRENEVYNAIVNEDGSLKVTVNGVEASDTLGNGLFKWSQRERAISTIEGNVIILLDDSEDDEEY